MDPGPMIVNKLQGQCPDPLKLSKQNSKIKHPILPNQSPRSSTPMEQPETAIYSTKTVRYSAEPSSFRSLVQQLTGRNPSAPTEDTSAVLDSLGAEELSLQSEETIEGSIINSESYNREKGYLAYTSGFTSSLPATYSSISLASRSPIPLASRPSPLPLASAEYFAGSLTVAEILCGQNFTENEEYPLPVNYSAGEGNPILCSKETIEQKHKMSETSKSDRIHKAYTEMLDCVNSLEKDEYSMLVESKSLDCVVFFKLFPKDYVIDREALIQLWIAEALVTEEPMEEIASAYLKALCEHGGFISYLKEDYSTGKMWYTLTEFTLPQKVLEMSSINPLRVVSDDSASVFSVKPEPCHVTLQHLPTKGLQALARYAHIKTILLLKDMKSNIDHVPYDFFISLPCLHTLNLSGTRISELPSSVGSATCLRFLDLSETLIKRLPETIDGLDKLQTLKLQNCTRLVALPKGVRRLTSLRHLEFSAPRSLSSMPRGMGALTALRTLSEFIANRIHGHSIDELKHMNELGGKLCLSKLENVANIVQAEQADLRGKQRLNQLELRWSENTDEDNIRIDGKVIGHLRPHTNIQELRILCYSGSAFPSWISHPSFTKLVNIMLFKCENCNLLPSLGQLHSLEKLSLIELTGVEIIDFRFCKDTPIAHVDHQFVAFPALQKLEIKSMLSLEVWRSMGRSSFPRLIELCIRDCPKLATLCDLSNITALEYIELNQCMKLLSFPAGDLPASVKTLVIESCPMLSLTSYVHDAQEWHKSHQGANMMIYERKEDHEVDE